MVIPLATPVALGILVFWAFHDLNLNRVCVWRSLQDLFPLVERSLRISACRKLTSGYGEEKKFLDVAFAQRVSSSACEHFLWFMKPTKLLFVYAFFVLFCSHAITL